jgi:hypothetical protein
MVNIRIAHIAFGSSGTIFYIRVEGPPSPALINAIPADVGQESVVVITHSTEDNISNAFSVLRVSDLLKRDRSSESVDNILFKNVLRTGPVTSH